MAVNLNGLDLSGAAASGSTRKAAPTHAHTTGSPPSTQPAQSEVNISSSASVLASAQKALAAQPAVDQSRVDAISKSLAAGTYRINPDKIASGLIDSERTLGKLR